MSVTIMWLLTILTTIGVGVYVTWLAFFLRNCPVLEPSGERMTDGPLISVVIPARNEAANIERCIRAVLSQHYANLEVIAVDDASTDATPEILDRLATEDPRLQVVSGGKLPSGWTGKNHAIYQGVQHAHGDWLLFIDADVTLQPSALGAAYTAAQQRGVALVTLWVRNELETFWERAIQPVVIGFNQVVDPWQRVSNPRHPETAHANGQFILIDRTVYSSIGGHSAVRDEVVEDQELAQRVKRAGHRILMLDGTQVAATRMYTSLHSIWEGWSKNNFLTLQRNYWLVLGAVIAVYLIAVSPFALIIWALVGFTFSQQILDPLLVNLASATLLMLTRWHTRHFFVTPFHTYLLYPIGGLVFMGIFINSAFHHTSRRGVTWKGRRYGDVDPVI